MQINFLPPNKNPPNCRQIRPIEQFWAYLKRNVYDNGKEFHPINQLVNRIRYLLKHLDLSGLLRAMD